MPQPPILLTTTEQWLPPARPILVSLVRPVPSHSRRVAASLPTSFLFPPTKILPLPTLQMQTILVSLVRPTMTRAIRQATVVRSELLPPTVTAVLRAVIGAPEVTLRAVAERIARVARIAHTDLFPPTVLAQPPPTAHIEINLAAFTRTRLIVHSRVAGPVVIQPPPTLDQQTLDISLAPQSRRAGMHFLGEPILPAPVAPLARPLAIATTRVRPRRTIWRLAPPVALQTFSGPEVTLVRTRPRPTTRSLGPPRALRTFTGPTVTLTRTRPRETQARLFPPTVVRVPSVEQVEQTIRVTLAETRPRRTLAKVAAPTVVKLVSAPIRVTLVKTRPRRTLAELSAPAAVTAFVAAPIRVALAETRPRRTLARFAGPVVVFPPLLAPPIRVALVKTRPARTRAKLATPIIAAAAQPIARPIKVALAKLRPRRTITRLPVTILQPLALPVKVALARIRPRPISSELRPQGITLPAVTKLAVRFAARTFDPRRRARSVLSPPAVIGARQRVPDTILVHLAPQARTTRHITSSLPRVIVPQALALAIRVTLTEARPRPTHIVRLAPAETPPVETALARSLTTSRPRAVHSVLRVPAVVAPRVLPLADQIKIVVRYRIAVDTRSGLVRRAPHFVLEPPTVVGIPRPPIVFTTLPPRGNWHARAPRGRWSVQHPAGNWRARKPHGRWHVLIVRGLWRPRRPRTP